MKALRSAQLQSSVQSSLLSTPRLFQRKLLGVAVGVVLGSGAIIPQGVVAQEQNKPSFALDTVVVTSRNREEIAQKVPLPVSVVGGKTLDRDNAVSVNDLVKKVPNLGVFGSNPRQTSISLRGIGKNAANDTMEPSVGVIVDGVVSSYVGQSWNDFIDLDRIEVIRGPQGTLLGKNTTLGVVNIVTKAPNFKPGYTYEVRYGDYNELGGKVTGTGAIVDDLVAYRGSLFFNKKDGVLDNVWQSGPETWNETNRVGGRLQFLVTPDETLSARIILDSIQSVENGNKSLLVDNGPDTFADGTARTTSFFSRLQRDYFNNPDGSKYQPVFKDGVYGDNKIEDSQARPQRTEQGGVSVELKKLLSDEYTLTSITAYREQHFDIKNGGVTRFDIGNGGQQLWNDQTSQELRLNYKGEKQYDYQVGLYYLDAEVYSDDPTYFGADAAAFNASNAQWNSLKAPKYRGLLTDAQRGVYRSYVLNPTTESYAAFGQVNWHFTEKSTLTLGLRNTYEHKEGRNRRELDRAGTGLTNATGSDNSKAASYGLDLANAADLAAWSAAKALYRSAIGTGSAGDKGIYDWIEGDAISDNSIAWLISPSYQLTNDVLLYGSLASGEKSGAVEFVSDSASPDYGQPLNVKPEKAENAELGFKSLLLDRRLLVNANIYYTQLTDYQSNLTVVDETQPTGLRSYLGNIPGVTAKGVEFESAFAVTPSLSVNFSGAYNRATYDEFFTTVPDISDTQLADYSGKQLHGAPKVTLAYGLDYTRTLGNGYGLNLFLTNAYRSDAYLQPSQSEYTLQKAYNLTDAGVALDRANGKYRISFIVKNLFDEHYKTGGNTYSSSNAITEQPGYGRAFSFAFRSNF
ncbi:TonB-dependent receptor [Cellvibrio sp. UBA7661]|uniref:TonB-dependent receptor n=1 Tax=Cellvibrio sp. UBA7661 TaxID=1946311 RepID=UPI002F357522